KTLRTNQVDRGRHQEGLDTHVHQTADGGGRIIRVQSRKHKVTGKRGLHTDFRGLKVSNLSDQNDVRILTEEGAERGSEVQSDLLLHLYLVDSSQLKFHRILG